MVFGLDHAGVGIDDGMNARLARERPKETTGLIRVRVPTVDAPGSDHVPPSAATQKGGTFGCATES